MMIHFTSTHSTSSVLFHVLSAAQRATTSLTVVFYTYGGIMQKEIYFYSKVTDLMGMRITDMFYCDNAAAFFILSTALKRRKSNRQEVKLLLWSFLSRENEDKSI